MRGGGRVRRPIAFATVDSQVNRRSLSCDRNWRSVSQPANFYLAGTGGNSRNRITARRFLFLNADLLISTVSTKATPLVLYCTTDPGHAYATRTYPSHRTRVGTVLYCSMYCTVL